MVNQQRIVSTLSNLAILGVKRLFETPGAVHLVHCLHVAVDATSYL